MERSVKGTAKRSKSAGNNDGLWKQQHAREGVAEGDVRVHEHHDGSAAPNDDVLDLTSHHSNRETMTRQLCQCVKKEGREVGYLVAHDDEVADAGPLVDNAAPS